MRIFIPLIIGWAMLATALGQLSTNNPNEVLIRVVDTGQGLCTVTSMPGHHYMVYDTGLGTKHCLRSVKEIIPPKEAIDLLVLSHTDKDHLGAAAAILHTYSVDRILRPGLKRDSETWKKVDKAIKEEVGTGAHEVNLAEAKPKLGTTYRYGHASVTFINGWSEPPKEWQISPTNTSWHNNAGSIVMRLEYKGGSVLFTGDTIGRDDSDRKKPATEPVFAEAVMVEDAEEGIVTLDSDVIIAPHHGADDGSSTDFIKAVSPTYVIFSAGNHKIFQHPRQATARRYVKNHVQEADMFRTDLGGNDGLKEWNVGQGKKGTKDPSGDDHIEIRIDQSGTVSVEYLGPKP